MKPLLDFSSVDSQLSLGELDSRIAWCRNETGYVRVRNARDLDLSLGARADIELIGEAYSEWVLDDLYLAFERTRSSEVLATGASSSEKTYRVIKARKRGNDVDAFQTDRKMKALRDRIREFIPDGLRTSSALYVTGTVDPKRVGYDVQHAWREFGKWFNSFVSSLRQKCATVEFVEKGGHPHVHEIRTKIYVVRSWESHESGWPHFHAILCFEGYPWEIFRDKKSRWRVKNKSVLEESWTHGFIDVVALTRGTLDKNIQNVLWYVSKNLSDMDYRLVRSWPQKRRLTQSILWYLGMRSFSVSRRLLEGDSERDPDDLIKRSCTTQMDLAGELAILELEKWEFLGLVHRSETELERDDWEEEYSEPPDWLDRCWKPHSGRSGLGWTSTWGS